MKKTTVLLVAVALLVPSFTFAAALTTGQVNAIMGVLAAFGVDQQVLNQVYADLTATTTVATTATTTIPTLATAAPVVPTFVAATSTVIAPAQGNTCGSNCITYNPTPAKTTVATTTPPVARACQVWFRDSGKVLAPADLMAHGTSTQGIIIGHCLNYGTPAEARAEGAYFIYNGDTTAMWQSIMSGNGLTAI